VCERTVTGTSNSLSCVHWGTSLRFDLRLPILFFTLFQTKSLLEAGPDPAHTSAIETRPASLAGGLIFHRQFTAQVKWKLVQTGTTGDLNRESTRINANKNG